MQRCIVLLVALCAGTLAAPPPPPCDFVGVCEYEPGDPPPPTPIYTALFAWNMTAQAWRQRVSMGDITNAYSGDNWFSKSGYSRFGYYYTQQIDGMFDLQWNVISSNLLNPNNYTTIPVNYLQASQQCIGSDVPGVAIVLANNSFIPAVVHVTGYTPTVVNLEKDVLIDVGVLPTEQYVVNPYDYCGFAKAGSIVGNTKLANSAFFFQNKAHTAFLFYDTRTGRKVASLPLPKSLPSLGGYWTTHPVFDQSRSMILVQNTTQNATLLVRISSVDSSIDGTVVLSTNTINSLVGTGEASLNEETHLYYYGLVNPSQDAYTYAYGVDYLNSTRSPVSMWLDPEQWGEGGGGGGMAGSSIHSIAACVF